MDLNKHLLTYLVSFERKSSRRLSLYRSITEDMQLTQKISQITTLGDSRLVT